MLILAVSQIRNPDHRRTYLQRYVPSLFCDHITSYPIHISLMIWNGLCLPKCFCTYRNSSRYINLFLLELLVLSFRITCLKVTHSWPQNLIFGIFVYTLFIHYKIPHVNPSVFYHSVPYRSHLVRILWFFMYVIPYRYFVPHGNSMEFTFNCVPVIFHTSVVKP